MNPTASKTNIVMRFSGKIIGDGASTKIALLIIGMLVNENKRINDYEIGTDLFIDYAFVN
ncbi:MAG: hypothetical protein HUJ51_02655 [Eggerthellaceae bacterium]|nr:hypothetical protein [Eggerthellaceae bacterium]